MDKVEYLKAKLPEITAIGESAIFTYLPFPVVRYIQAAENLFDWCQPDKDILIKAGLDWKLVDDLLARAGALREAEADWISQRFTKKEKGKLWNERSDEMYDLHALLLHEFRHAYKDNTYVSNRVDAIAGNQSNVEMIQNLSNLSVIGKNNPAELTAINFDFTLLDKSKELSREMARLLAGATAEGEYNAAKKIRDQAFTFLKLAVDEICENGQYAFWKNETRRKGYSSTLLRRARQKKVKSDTEQADGRSAL